VAEGKVLHAETSLLNLNVIISKLLSFSFL